MKCDTVKPYIKSKVSDCVTRHVRTIFTENDVNNLGFQDGNVARILSHVKELVQERTGKKGALGKPFLLRHRLQLRVQRSGERLFPDQKSDINNGNQTLDAATSKSSLCLLLLFFFFEKL